MSTKKTEAKTPGQMFEAARQRMHAQANEKVAGEKIVEMLDVFLKDLLKIAQPTKGAPAPVEPAAHPVHIEAAIEDRLVKLQQGGLAPRATLLAAVCNTLVEAEATARRIFKTANPSTEQVFGCYDRIKDLFAEVGYDDAGDDFIESDEPCSGKCHE